jgi:hypothetical protein
MSILSRKATKVYAWILIGAFAAMTSLGVGLVLGAIIESI